MSSLWGRRNTTIRLLVVAGLVLQLLTWLMNLVLFPSVVITIVAGITGVRRLERDDDDAVLRLGVALVTSLIASGLSILSGAAVLVVVAWASSGFLLAAWLRLRVLAADRRRSWAIRHQDITRRRIELEQRQQALRDRLDR